MRIVTPTCLLRPPHIDDAAAIARHADDHAVWRWLRDRFPHPYRESDAAAWIAAVHDAPGPPTNFVIDVEGTPVGGIALAPGTDVERVSCEVGYWVGRAAQGRGIATDALRGITHHAFEVLRFVRVFALPFAHNEPSLRVLARAGYVREATLRCAAIKEGAIVDQALFAAIRDEWAAGDGITIAFDDGD